MISGDSCIKGTNIALSSLAKGWRADSLTGRCLRGKLDSAYETNVKRDYSYVEESVGQSTDNVKTQ